MTDADAESAAESGGSAGRDKFWRSEENFAAETFTYLSAVLLHGEFAGAMAGYRGGRGFGSAEECVAYAKFLLLGASSSYQEQYLYLHFKAVEGLGPSMTGRQTGLKRVSNY